MQDWGYTVYSTLGAFYIPLGFMIVIYLNVYRVARRRIRKKQFRRQITVGDSVACDSPTTRATPAVNGRRAASHGESTKSSRPGPHVDSEPTHSAGHAGDGHSGLRRHGVDVADVIGVRQGR